MEDETMSEDKVENFKVFFVSIIKNYPILLDRSMLPSKRDLKQHAINEIKVKIKEALGVTMTDYQITKRLQNMKSRLKKRTDRNQTIQKKIILKDWEEDLLRFLEGGSNPTEVSIEDYVAAGTSDSKFADCGKEESEFFEPEADIVDIQEAPQHLYSPKNERTSDLEETEYTINLSTPELQRLVLLGQLRYFKKAEKLVDLKIKELELRQQERASRPSNHHGYQPPN